MAKEYELETMADLFKIPLDRFDDFMIDLKSWRELGGNTMDLFNSIADAVDEPQPKIGIKMRWIDDGKHDKKVIIAALSNDENKE